jgi:WD40 repeat protein
VASPHVLERLPSVVALGLRDYQTESDPLLKAWHMCDFVEICLRTMVALAVGDWLNAAGELPAALRRELGARIEQPTLGKWRGMALALCKQPPSATCLPELYGFVADVLDPAMQGASVNDSLLALRNRLAHGGGMSRNLAARLLAAHQERFANIVQSMDWLGEIALVVPGSSRDPDERGSMSRMLGPTTALTPMWLDPDLHGAARAAAPGAGAVVALRGRRALNLWPLLQYGSPGERDLGALDPVPLIYARRDAMRLLLTPLGSEQAAMAEADRHALGWFEGLIERAARPRIVWQVPGFEAELHRDASHVVGRRGELDTLARAASAVERGVLWISAPAGMGKSLLLAAFHAESIAAQEAQVGPAEQAGISAGNLAEIPAQGSAPSALVLAYRFKVGDPRCSREHFLRFAVERLEHRHPDAASRRRPTPARLGELLDREARAVLVLDGIDEIAAVDPGFAADVPLYLADRALWICAGRPERGLDQTFARPGCRRVFPAGLPPLSAADTRAMLLDKIGPLSKRLLRCETDRGDTSINPFVDRVVARAQGLPIYVTYVIGDVLSGRLREFDERAALPPSLDAYHCTLLERSGVGSVAQLLTPMLAALAIAREPLPAEVLHALLLRRTLVTDSPAGRAAVHAALGRLAPLLALVPADDRGALGHDAYALFHLPLRGHVLASPAMSEAVATARLAMNRAARTVHQRPADPARPYLLCHGITHLTETHDAGLHHAAALLCDFAYLMTRARGGGATELLADMALVPDPRLDPWRAFLSRNAHLVGRGERGGATALLQAAIADADTSPVTAAAEAWLARGGRPEQAWLRRLDRPRDPVLDPRVRTLEGHGAAVTSLALVRAPGQDPGLAPELLLSAGADATLRLWDVDTGACVRTLQQGVDDPSQSLAAALITSVPRATCMSDCEGPSWTIWSVDVLPDNRTAIAAHGDATIKLWDLHSGTCIASLSGHEGYIWCVRACCDSSGRRALSAGDDGKVRIWDLDARTCVSVLDAPTWLAGAAFGPGGRSVIAGGGDNLVRVWDLATGACVRALAGHKSYVRAVALASSAASMHGRALALSGSHDGTIAVWDLDRGRCLRSWQAHEGGVWSLAPGGQDGQVISTGQRGGAALWDVATGTQVRAFRGHAGRIWAALDMGDGEHIATSGQDRTITLWSTTASAGPGRAAHTGPVHAIALSPDGGQALTAGEDGTVKLWELGDRQLLRTLVGHRGPVRAVAWLGEGRALSAGHDGTLRIWQLSGAAGNASCAVLDLSELEQITALSICDQVAVAAGTSGAVVRCDLASGARVVLGSHHGPALTVAFLPGAPGRALSGGADALIHIWDIASGALIKSLRGHSWDVQVVAAAPDCVLSACRDGAIHLWNPHSGGHRRAAAEHDPDHPVLAVAGAYALSAARDKTLEIWPLAGGAPVARWPAHAAITAVAATPDHTLVCGDATGELIHLRLVEPDS